MLKQILILSALIGLSLAAVDLWGKCGGEGYSGVTACKTGTYCKVVNQWHHQCEPGTGGGSSATAAKPPAPAPGPAPAPAPASGPAPTGPGLNPIPLPPKGRSYFHNGLFRHVIAYDGSIGDDTYKKYDGISIWLNTIDDKQNTNFNPWYQGAMLKKALELNKIPIFYAYIIAFEARVKAGLQDCDVDKHKNLCHFGSKFIRENRDYLVSRYKHQASEIAKIIGKNGKVVFLMEPDFWQYHGDKTQDGGVLSGPYMRKLFDDFVAAIKSELPDSRISFDISAWIGVEGMKEWWSHFASSKDIDFINTSGGQANGQLENIKPNELRWLDVARITGRRIIADCGYGVAGASASNCGVWNLSNKQNRVKNGVFALSAGIGAKDVAPPSLDRITV